MLLRNYLAGLKILQKLLYQESLNKLNKYKNKMAEEEEKKEEEAEEEKPEESSEEESSE